MVPQRSRQIILLMPHWMRAVELSLIDAQVYSVLDLGGACACQRRRLMAPLRLDAVLYVAARPRLPGTNGRPHVKGERLPQLRQAPKEAQTIWQYVRVRWYSG